MKTSLLILFYLSTITIVIAQDISSDSEGNEIFQSYTADNFKATLTSGDEQAIKFNYCLPLARYYYTLINDTAARTIATSRCLTTSFNLKTSNSVFNVAKRKEFNPGFTIGIGYQRTLDKFYNIDRLPTNAYATGFLLYYRMDNFKYYDTIGLSETRKLPGSYGINGHITFYKPFNKKWVALSVSGQIENSWNIDALSQYQKNSPIYVNNQVISLGDFQGKLGNLHRAYNYRIRVSTPLFFPTLTERKALNKLCVIPYFVLYGMYDKTLEYNKIVGLSVNFLDKPLRSNQEFSILEGFGLGIDYAQTSDGWTGPNIFITGTLNFFDFSEENRKLSPHND